MCGRKRKRERENKGGNSANHKSEQHKCRWTCMHNRESSFHEHAFVSITCEHGH